MKIFEKIRVEKEEKMKKSGKKIEKRKLRKKTK